MTSNTKIALCTDTHFWPGTPNSLCADGRIQLQSASEEIQASLLMAINEENPDLIIHMGDWSCGGGSFNMPEETFYQTLRDAKDAFCSLGCPVYTLPGNHDCPPGGDYSFFAELWGTTPGLGQTIDLPNARLILLNTHGHSANQLAAAYPNDPISGWVSDAELARIEEALLTAENKPVIFFIHQLLAPWSIDQPWLDLYQIDNGEQVLDLMRRYGNVVAVFQGHAHLLDITVQQIGGTACTFVVTPALIEYPVAWLSLELTPECLIGELQRLPLDELAEQSRCSGEGQSWRAGNPEWHQFRIELE